MFTLNLYCHLRYCLQLLCPVYLFCCLHMLSFSQCEDFSTHYCTIVYIKCLHWIFTIIYGTVYNYSAQYSVCVVYISFLLQCDIFSQSLPNSLYNNVYSISSTYTYSTIYNYTTRYTNFAVYICCPFHNVIFFHNHCTIDSTTMSIAYPQHIHTILFTITLRSMLTLLFTYASFSQCDIIFTITAQLTLQQCLQHIRNIYIQYCSQLHYPVYWLCCLYMLPLHNVIFFHNHCTIDSTTMSTAYP